MTLAERSPAPVVGTAYLVRAITGRFEQLSEFSDEVKARGGSETFVLSSHALAIEGLTYIVLGIGHQLTHEPRFDVDRFGAFVAQDVPVGVVFEAAPELTSCWEHRRPWPSPLIDAVMSDNDWGTHLRSDKVGAPNVVGVLDGVLGKRRREGDAPLTPPEAASAAELCVAGFFATLARGLVHRQPIILDGLGQFESVYGGIAFAAHDRLRDAVRLAQLRDRVPEVTHTAYPYALSEGRAGSGTDRASLLELLHKRFIAERLPDAVIGLVRRALKFTIS